MNTYRVTSGAEVVDHKEGAVFDHDFSPEVEADLLAAGRIVIEPRRYKVVGSSSVNETAPGGFFLGAFTRGQEAALLAGGHIERARPIAAAGKPTDTATTSPTPITTTTVSPAAAGEKES